MRQELWRELERISNEQTNKDRNLGRIKECFYCTARNTECERYKPMNTKQGDVCFYYIELTRDIVRVRSHEEPKHFPELDDWLKGRRAVSVR